MADRILSILSLRGGLNDTDPSVMIPDDQVVTAENVEFDKSALGERRKGCTAIDLPVAITGDPLIEAITFMTRHFPSTNDAEAELFIFGQNLTTQHYLLYRKNSAWAAVSLAASCAGIGVTSGWGYQIKGQSIHAKLFLAFRALDGADRLHVWDGTSLRASGLAQPAAAPTATDTGSGSYKGDRYARVRMTVKEFGVTTRRSEASETLTQTPSGSGTGLIFTRPTAVEDATHWELELSLDNRLFYRYETAAIATTTITDSTAFATGYSEFTLSDEAGHYALLPSAKYLSSDEDRLLFGGSWEVSALASRFGWTPVYGDPTGVGNDERFPTASVNFLDLDGFAGGPLTGISQPVNDYTWVFKWGHTYRLERTDIRANAYRSRKISGTIGAIPGSVVEGVDQYGMACLYFWDPKIGPCRTGGNKVMQTCGRDITKGIVRSVNLDATALICRSVYYADSRQVHFWLATDDSNIPNKKVILQTNETREFADGIRKGWTTADGKISRAYSACMFADDIDDNANVSLSLRPFIGVSAADGYVLRCDTGDDDDGTEYTARIVTKPFTPMGLLQKFRVGAAALLAAPASAVSVVCSLLGDYEKEEPIPRSADLTPAGDETQVTRFLDSASTASIQAIQVAFEDSEVFRGNWELNRLDIRISEEETLG